MPGVVFQAFTDCDCCPGVPCSGAKPALLFCRWGSADTFRRVLKVSPAAQGQDIGPAWALRLREVAQELPRGWGCTDDAAVKEFPEVCRADAVASSDLLFSHNADRCQPAIDSGRVSLSASGTGRVLKTLEWDQIPQKGR